jgi:heme-degrading monooxygenase HmoA
VPPAVQSERAVTVLATRRVRDGAQPQFEDFLQRLLGAFASVTGFLGLTVLPRARRAGSMC